MVASRDGLLSIFRIDTAAMIVKNPFCQRIPTSPIGLTLRSWVIYQNISLLRSNYNIVEEMHEIFKYQYPWNIATRFKSHAAVFYEPTYNQLFTKIRSGHLLHADETSVSLIGIKGYVWAFTNLEEVVYVYSDTREGTVLLVISMSLIRKAKFHVSAI